MAEVQSMPLDYNDVLRAQRGGFSFELCNRNAYLAEKAAIKPPTAMKSSTTICGVICKDESQAQPEKPEEPKVEAPDPLGIRAMFKEMNIHTLSNDLRTVSSDVHTLSTDFTESKNDVRILQDWCQQCLDDLDERTATAFAASVDMIEKVEERVDEIEQDQEDQKREVGRHADDIKELKEAIE